MFDSAASTEAPVQASPATEGARPAVDLDQLLSFLTTLTGADMTDPDRITTVALLERLKNTASAAQARVTLAFDTSQRATAGERGVKTPMRGRGIAEQIALARRESPFRGAQHLALARALPEMPHTMTALACGETSEWRAASMMRQTAALSREDRAAVDAEVGPRLPDLGDREAAAEARQAGYRLDPHSLVNRIKRAQSDRNVSVRPAPDTMSYFTGTVPMVQGVAMYTALRKQAEPMRAAGDPRSMGQLMADLPVSRVTGLADHGDGVKPSVEVHLVMTDESPMGQSDEPADVVGGESLPAWLTRRIVADAHEVWLRRLHTAPDSEDLVATDTRRRAYT